ncbi:MAG: NnrU family protein [Dongiaceae bacterium]
MTLLIAGLVLFIGTHLLPNFAALRASAAARLGENPYKMLFSVVSVAGLVLIAIGYGRAPYEQIFEPSRTARLLLPPAMAIVFMLFGIANLQSRIRRLVRHPMLGGLLIWSALHFMANGDLASNVMFGAFALWSVFAILSAEHRGKRPSYGPGNLKYDAIGAIAGLLVFAIVFYFHASLFGVSPV